MAIVNKPNTFSGNTTISSSQINSNFDTLYNEFNGSISAANLADDAVTSAKLADNAVVTANITDANVTPAKLVAGTGTSWAWQSWTPTWTNVTISSSTVVAKYLQTGKTVNCLLAITGAGSFAVSGSMILTAPVNISSNYTAREVIGQCSINDVSTGAFYLGQVWRASATTVEILVGVTDATYLKANATTNTVPMTWTNGDIISATFTYEAA